MVEHKHDQMVEESRALVKKLDAFGWGLFFIWIGIAFLADVGWGVGLLGIGVIALGAQGARKYFNLPVEQFGLVMGIVFVVWGAWKLLDIQLGRVPIPGGFLPILLILVGMVLVVSALWRTPRR